MRDFMALVHMMTSSDIMTLQFICLRFYFILRVFSLFMVFPARGGIRESIWPDTQNDRNDVSIAQGMLDEKKNRTR